MQALWRFIPAELAHHMAPLGLTFYSSIWGASTPQWQPVQWEGLSFANPLGLAGGMDKNGDQVLAWQKMGASFLEVGTVTPRPQKANPGKIVDRDWINKILWNKMGFPSYGVEDVYFNLLHHQPELKVPVFVNIGKNRDTSAKNAVKDYQILVHRLAPVASAFVINVSSPNTQGLRDLQAKAQLIDLIGGTRSTLEDLGINKPILVKLSPDLSTEQLKEAIDASLEAGAKGITLTNTTLKREANSLFPKEGGLSGAAVKDLAMKALETATQLMGKKNPSQLLISVGGILNAQDIQERLSLGADLVQVYSALVFEGPRFFQNIGSYFQKNGVKH